MTFKPGQSGNPGGRPKALKDIQKAARAHSADALKTLARIATDPKAPEAAQIAASTALLDRGFGKPLQSIDALNTNVNYAVGEQPMTEEEWADQRVTEH